MDQSSPRGSAPARRRGNFLRWILLLLLIYGAVGTGLSWIVQHTRLRRSLTARIEAAFGRPVEVGRFDVSLLGPPRLVAESVTVAEDPRFGSEYFLRAEELTASLRWGALLRGKLELDTLSFTQASLNLVRSSDGGWNLAEWLPRPTAPASSSAARNSKRATVPQLARIEFSGGRINFKRGADKAPFALVGVSGRAEQVSPGRWQLDIEARPMRAATPTQQAGTIRLQGLVGGTSSRLRPAEFALNWQDAALADILRLVRGSDFGVRGQFSLNVTARTKGSGWTFTGKAGLRRLHRWDLPLRPDDPAGNLSLEARWSPESSRLELTQVVLDAPRSNLRAEGFLVWAWPGNADQPSSLDAGLEVHSTEIQLADVLSVYRAFHAGVADELELAGRAGLELSLRGWPPRVERGELVLEDARLEGGSIGGPVVAAHAELRLDHTAVEVPPFDVTFGSGAGLLRVAASVERRPNGKSGGQITGQVEKVEELLDAGAALGWPSLRGWRFEGPARVDLRWKKASHLSWEEARGTIEFGQGLLHTSFLNQPIDIGKARVERRSGEQRVSLESAQAFGAHWTGSLARRDASDAWEFALSADRLDAADFDRWLNPHWQEGPLARVLPFLASSAPSGKFPSGLHAQGSLAVEEVVLAPLVLRGLHAEAGLDGRRLDLSKAEAQFYGGSVLGSLTADFTNGPSYRVDVKFDRVNLTALSDATATLKDRFAGSASGRIEITARGAGRAALLSGLACRGESEIANPEFRGVTLYSTPQVAVGEQPESDFRNAAAEFTCGAGKVEFQGIRLSGVAPLEASGSVSFSRGLDLHVKAVPPSLAEKNSGPEQTLHLTGTLESPQITRLDSTPPPR
jgi:hypothetical protein